MSSTAAQIDEAARILREAKRLVVFTGAGVSAESGIDTFRTDGGLWERYPPEEFATPGAILKMLATDPARVARFLRDVLEPVARARPNPGHEALSVIEERVRERGGDAVVVTQNIDRLHQDAGSRSVLEVHGSLFDLVDDEGLPRGRLERADLSRIAERLAKAERGLLKRSRIVAALSPLLSVRHRPNVVLFGEGLPEPAWSKAVEASRRADAMLVVGTSGAVYPAASLTEVAAEAGARLVGVGPERGDADVWLEGNAGVLLPAVAALG